MFKKLKWLILPLLLSALESHATFSVPDRPPEISPRISSPTSHPTFAHFAHFVVSSSSDPSGSVEAEYEYSPFGELTASSGAMADENPFRFSTKYWDIETGLGYWGMRYYHPAQGRWLSRDPLGEEGGLLLYGFVGNDPVNYVDFLGLRKEVTVIIHPAVYQNEHDNNEDIERGQVAKLCGEKGWIDLEEVDIADANKKLRSVKCDCIKELHILGHGNRGFQNISSKRAPAKVKARRGRLGVRWNSRKLNHDYYGFQIFRKVEFCDPCTITLRGCYTGLGSLGRKLYSKIREVTGCQVLGYDVPTRPSNVGDLPSPGGGPNPPKPH